MQQAHARHQSTQGLGAVWVGRQRAQQTSSWPQEHPVQRTQVWIKELHSECKVALRTGCLQILCEAQDSGGMSAGLRG